MSDLERLNQYHILLASMSPRRRFLLNELGLKFDVITGNDVEETYPPHLVADKIPLYLARLKAKAFGNLMKENTILITADTIVWLNNEVIGKPCDPDDARMMLHKLSGNMHYVYTGVCIASRRKEYSFTAETKVFFRPLSEAEINFYVDRYSPMDKAGAYGVQEWIGYIGVERIEGSYFNVMGMPVQMLYKALLAFIGE